MPALLNDRLILMVPKAASTSLRRAAKEAGGCVYDNCHDTLDQFRERHPDVTFSESIAVIRHPLDTLVSLWRMQSRLYPMLGDFKWFVEHYQTKVYMSDSRLFKVAEGADRVFLYERLEEVEQYLGLSLPHLNKAKGGKARRADYYDQETYQIARQRFHLDFEMYAAVADREEVQCPS